MFRRNKLFAGGTQRRGGGVAPGGGASPATPPLDGLSDVAHAYGLRLMLTSYVGQCIKLKRSSDNAELDFGFSSGALDAAAIATWLGGNTGTVVTWYDQVGSANLVSVAAGVITYIASAANSKPALRGAGTGGKLKVTDNISQPFTALVCGKSAAGANDGHFFDSLTRALMGVSSGNFAMYAGALLSGGAVDTNTNIHSAVFNGGSSKLYKNGGTAASGNAGSGGAGSEIYLFAGDTEASVATLSGDIAEWVLTSTSIPAADHNVIGASMATYYGPTWSSVS